MLLRLQQHGLEILRVSFQVQRFGDVLQVVGEFLQPLFHVRPVRIEGGAQVRKQHVDLIRQRFPDLEICASVLANIDCVQRAVIYREAGADVIGANCGRGIAGYLPVCARLRAATSRPVWIKANAGLPEIVDGQLVYQNTPEQFAALAPALIEGGANFIGGCCGTSPDFIRALKLKVSACG